MSTAHAAHSTPLTPEPPHVPPDYQNHLRRWTGGEVRTKRNDRVQLTTKRRFMRRGEQTTDIKANVPEHSKSIPHELHVIVVLTLNPRHSLVQSGVPKPSSNIAGWSRETNNTSGKIIINIYMYFICSTHVIYQVLILVGSPLHSLNHLLMQCTCCSIYVL